MAEVTLDTLANERYEYQLHSWLGEIQRYCRQRAVHFVTVSTEEAWDQLVFRALRRQGVVS